MSKISRKLYILLVLSVGISVTISSWFITAYLLVQSEQDNHEKDLIYVDGLADSMERFLEHAVTLNYQLSLNPDIKQTILETIIFPEEWEARQGGYAAQYDTQGGLSGNSGLPLLTGMQQRYNFVELLFVQDEAGDQTARSFGNLGQRAERWWYRRIVGNRDYRPFISHSYYSLTGDKPVASIFHPIREEGRFIGIMGMDINFQHLQEVISASMRSRDMYAIVTDMEGVIIAHPDAGKLSEIYNLISMTRSVLSGQNGASLDRQGYLDQQVLPLDWPEEISRAVRAAVGGEKGYLENIPVESDLSNLYYAPISLFPEGNAAQNYAVLLVHKKGGIVQTRNRILLVVTFFIIAVVMTLFFIFGRQYRKNILNPLDVLIQSMSSSDMTPFKEISLETEDEFHILAGTYNDLRRKLDRTNKSLQEKLEILHESEAGYKAFADIGLALSTETDILRLMELILDEARNLTNADGGTLYLHKDGEKHLDFSILHTETLRFHMGGTSGTPVTLPPVPLYDDQGNPNHSHVSAHAALTGEIINIPDVYSTDQFDFRGTREYDAKNGYRSQSMLVIPMKNMEDELIGVIQLINARRKGVDQVIPFAMIHENLAVSLASQAAVALTNVQLHKELEKLFHAFIKSIATAIDEKSAFTGDHIRRVVILTMMIAEEINKDDSRLYGTIHFTPEEMEELRIAAWMHDIGKITTPESLIDKQTKLQGYRDGMELIEMRYQLLQQNCSGDSRPPADATASEELQEELDFLRRCNQPGEFLTDDKLERLSRVREKTYPMGDGTHPLLTAEEHAFLSIRKGSLSPEERNIIEQHADVSKRILMELPFPKQFSNVAVYASMHHEKLDGSGYPEGLRADQIPLQARIIALADIFEALTARDRPYRKPLSLSKAFDIMQDMVKKGHIDGDILNLMARSGMIYRYAGNELAKKQIDAVTVDSLNQSPS